MTLRHKFILSSAVAAIVASSAITSDAFAARHPVMNEETSQAGAVLFRVENIQPVKDSEGLTNKCSFIVTVFNRMDKEGDEKKLLITAADNGYPDAIHYLVRDYESTSGDSVGKAIDAVGSIFSFGLFSGVTNYIINQAQYEKYQTMLKNFGIPEGYYTPLRSV